MNFNIFNIKIKLKNNFDVFRCIHATEIRVYSCNKSVHILKQSKKKLLRSYAWCISEVITN